MDGVGDAVGALVAVELGVALGVVAAADGAMEGVIATVGLALVGLGVDVGLGVRVGVSGTGVSGAAHAVTASAVPRMTKNRIDRMDFIGPAWIEFGACEYSTLRRRVKIICAFDTRAIIY
jgi:hypothetical protein